MAKTHGEADENNFHYTVLARKLHKRSFSGAEPSPESFQ